MKNTLTILLIALAVATLAACGAGGGLDNTEGTSGTSRVFITMTGAGLENFSSSVMKGAQGEGDGTVGGTIEGLADTAAVKCQFDTSLFRNNKVHTAPDLERTDLHDSLDTLGVVLNDAYIDVLDGNSYAIGHSLCLDNSVPADGDCADAEDWDSADAIPAQTCAANAVNLDNCIVCTSGYLIAEVFTADNNYNTRCALQCTGTVFANLTAASQYIPVFIGVRYDWAFDGTVAGDSAIRMLMWPNSAASYWPEMALYPGTVAESEGNYYLPADANFQIIPNFASSIFWSGAEEAYNQCNGIVGSNNEFKATLQNAGVPVVVPADLIGQFVDVNFLNDLGSTVNDPNNELRDSYNIFGVITAVGTSQTGPYTCRISNWMIGALPLAGVDTATVDLERGFNIAGAICDDKTRCALDYSSFE